MRAPVNKAGARHEILDKTLEEDGRLAKNTRKMLVLGARGSGKATFMRHIKCLYEGYTEQERQEFKNLIYAKIIAVCRQMFSSLPDEVFSTSQIQKCRRVLLSPPENCVLNVELIGAIHTLWTDDDVAKVIPTSQLDASTLYFLNSIDRVASPDYIPTDSDILRCNMDPTPPVDEVSVKIGDRWTYSMISVRQNLATKHKWFPFFDGIPVIFLIKLDDYDQPERMREAVDLFNYVCNSPFFDLRTIHVLLNTSDSFLTKIARSPLSATFPGFSGGCDYLRSVKYICWRFSTLKCPPRLIHPYLLDVTNANTVRVTMDSVVRSFDPYIFY
ncbi:guanine nucleotide binding protein, alpha subunit [Mycena epipterygia]|nr:guanine nucleotide binding protein, alpha subunit [Mycena epipterygia]